MSNPSAEPIQAPAADSIRTLLTPRQLQIVACLLRGLQNVEIAQELGTTEGAVNQHMLRIARRLNVRGRVQIALRIARYFPGEVAA